MPRNTVGQRSAIVCVIVAFSVIASSCASTPPPGTGSTAVATTVGSTGPSAETTTAGKKLSLVVLGDSIPYNSSADCPGCTGFVDQYATALSRATGHEVETQDYSDHTGLTVSRLRDGLETFKDDIASADAVIVGIAHNGIPLGDDEPCGSALNNSANPIEDWSKITQACANAATRKIRPVYDHVYSSVAGWRKGKPTILLTINKYNDWISADGELTAAQNQKTVMMHDTWNKMICDSATANGFTCADIYTAFNGRDGSRPSGDLLGDDYTHPSQKGNDLIAKVLVATGFKPLA